MSAKVISNTQISSHVETNDFKVQYSDLAQCLEKKDIKRFEYFANYTDLNEIQKNHKPFLFYAIEQNDNKVLKFLLEYDIDLNMKFLIDLSLTSTTSSENAKSINDSHTNKTYLSPIELYDNKLKKNRSTLFNTTNDDFDEKSQSRTTLSLLHSNYSTREVSPYEYAKILDNTEGSMMIEKKLADPTVDEKLQRVINMRDINEFRKFKQRLKSTNEVKKYVSLPNGHVDLIETYPLHKFKTLLGFIKSIQINCLSLVEYFINVEHLDVNCKIATSDGYVTTPLLLAISSLSKEVVRYLIFRGANIHTKGKYGDSLVTAIHYNATPDVVTLLLEKGAMMTSRHSEWSHLSLREYCIQFSKVKAKLALDEFVCKLIANGKYKKLKYLTENGYKHINVRNHLRKCGRDIAIERYHINIVKLIDILEENERRINTKMNYS